MASRTALLLTAALAAPTLAWADRINDLAFADDKSVAVALQDHSIRIVEAPSGKELRKITCPENAARLAVSRDGKALASAEFTQLAVYDLSTGKEKVRVERALGATDIEALAISPDGTAVAVAGGVGRVKLFDAATGKELRAFEGLKKIVAAVAFSPDGKTLAAAGLDNLIALWSVDGKQPMKTLAPSKNRYEAILFTRDGKQLISVDQDAAIAVWNLSGGEPVATMKGEKDYTHRIALTRDGKTLAWDGADYKVTLWDLGAKKELAKVVAASSTCTDLAFSPNGKLLAVGDEAGKVHLLDVAKASAVEVPLTK